MTVRVNLIEADINDFLANPWNPNHQTDFIYDKERQSIRTHGFIDPILVRQTDEGYQIIDGEHRWKAAKDEGFETLPANNLGQVEDHVAKQLTIIMNETRGQADRKELGALLKELSEEVAMEDLSVNLPYTETELNQLMSEQEIDWDSLDQGEDSGKGGTGSDKAEVWEEFKIKLPESLHGQVLQEIKRMQRAIDPQSGGDDVPQHQAFEAMIQLVAQTPERQLI